MNMTMMIKIWMHLAYLYGDIIMDVQILKYTIFNFKSFEQQYEWEMRRLFSVIAFPIIQKTLQTH